VTKIARTLSLALAAALAVSACQSTNKPPRGSDNETLVAGRLAQVNPLEVVVLPIENATGGAEVPVDVMRTEFVAGLVTRRYTPLAVDYVDERAVEASYQPGAMNEQAVLRVVVTMWDDALLSSHGRVTVQADVHLLDAGAAATGEALWGGTLQREIQVGAERKTGNRKSLAEIAAREFAQDVLASLPPRDPRR
jgi:hypothetical protein